ncbi:hypothetical protein [Streptomyces sp. NPDC059278]|uniref:hypothetical protein n=1 Tax=Streptomyces sp. NPDC059278 TaxID=3346801 RepID=UPI0036994050
MNPKIDNAVTVALEADESAPVTERIPNVSLTIEGDDNVAIFRSILEAEHAAHVGTQTSVSCRHCGNRILHTTGKLGTFWWHVATTNDACAEGDTKADPEKGD